MIFLLPMHVKDSCDYHQGWWFNEKKKKKKGWWFNDPSKFLKWLDINKSVDSNFRNEKSSHMLD
jgi:hypothetical protein